VVEEGSDHRAGGRRGVHVWRINDFVMWDNRSIMHRGRRFGPQEARDIRQARLAGDGPTIAQTAA
jgi:alpha-ketoglutarate-dependent 2,4-dichlorophenoxyacetate dioxygenase